VTALDSKVGQGFPNAHEPGALASSPKDHIASTPLDLPAYRVLAAP
jgi:hypothetical protein